MKITIETIENALVEVTLDYMGETYKELWEHSKLGYSTRAEGIQAQLEKRFEKLVCVMLRDTKSSLKRSLNLLAYCFSIFFCSENFA